MSAVNNAPLVPLPYPNQRQMPTRMRPTFLLMVIAGLIASPRVSRAQHVGLTAARTTSDIVTKEGNGVGLSHPDRNAISAGITYRHHLRSRAVLQTELLWVPKGFNRQSTPTRTLSYVEVPVLLRIGALAQTGARFSPVLSLGPTIAVLATCRLQGLNAVSRSEHCDQVLTTPFAADYRMRRFDAGLMLGVGLEGRTGDGTILGVEARIERGMLDIERQRGTSQNRTVFVGLHVVPARLY